MIVWCNGELVDESAVRISPFDHGLLTGDGVFETLATVSGVPFAWTRHLHRLHASAAGLGLRGLPDDDVLRSAADAVIAANPSPGELRLRITVTGGDAPPGSGRGDGPPLVLMTATPLPLAVAMVDVALAPWPRNERGATTGLKTTSYAENVVALAWAHERDAGEAVLANTLDQLCEGTGTNVFLVLGDPDSSADPTDSRNSGGSRDSALVVTPPLSSGCLAGVTRALVIEIGGDRVVERAVAASALGAATEAFLTSTTRAVQPIRLVDGRPLPQCPGPRTRELAQAFAHLMVRDLDP